MHYCNSTNTVRIMNCYQIIKSAYRENYSCETALIKIVNDILWCVENQHVSMLVALDLSAAFNMVDHKILLSVLNKKFGVTGNVYIWFDMYLRPRGCKVNVKNSYSEEKNLPYCVPQGSVVQDLPCILVMLPHFRKL